jgi:hypothetical protein
MNQSCRWTARAHRCMAQNGSRVAIRRQTRDGASSAPPGPSKRSHKENSAYQGTEFWISLTDKVLLQPFNESERQRADYLGCQQQPLLGCGPATCRPLGAAPKPGPRRKLRATSHLSKSMSSTPSHQNRRRYQSRPRTARTHGTLVKPRNRGFRTTHPALKHERAALPHQMLLQKELRQSSTEFWISLTDKHKLRRSQIKAAARAASAAAFHQSLRRQLHALLGCGPATSSTTEGETIQPARSRKLRWSRDGSKTVLCPHPAPRPSA